MNSHDPNVIGVELAVDALAELADEFVLVGGCAVGLLITDLARPAVRRTIDVDLIVQVASLHDYYVIEKNLRKRGFSESSDATHMGRWTRGLLILDVMPSDHSILGHSTNRWYPSAFRSANRVLLPSGRHIRLIAAPFFIATKLDAFYDRGRGDYVGSHDMEDIVNVIDGRPELGDEVIACDAIVKTFLRAEFDDLLADAKYLDSLPGHFGTDAASQVRVKVVVDRLMRLAGL